MSVLYHSGAYLAPAQKASLNADHAKEMYLLGDRWRSSWINKETAPSDIGNLWSVIIDSAATPLHELGYPEHGPLRTALLSLCVAADEACRRIGAGESLNQKDSQYPFYFDAFSVLSGKDFSTLCRSVHPSVCRVLPKSRTCQSGFTVRSLSHWLAYCPPGEVTTRWYPGASISPFSFKDSPPHLNLLLVPWPFEVLPTHFTQARGPELGPLSFFSYRAPEKWGVVELVDRLIDRSQQVVGPLAGVILPELALCPDECNTLKAHTLEKQAFLFAGVNEFAGLANSKNRVEMSFPYVGVSLNVGLKQNKHHRWRLDQQQIIRYGLGSRLPIEEHWWEGISIEPREVNFLELRKWLVTCVLICEDLARPDPVADIIRSVGPNLVVALLHDGPQFKSRWQARYASVLADDPGSSVLTLTSLGMAQLSRELQTQERSRVVALWKDQSSSLIEISLPEGCDGIVLSLAVKMTKEWTADRRPSDNEDTGANRAVLKLAGIHPISLTT